MFKRIALAAAVSMVALAAPGQAGFDEGQAALERGDFTAAIMEFKPLADQGFARAQFRLGVMYENGHGVAPDDAEALKWYRRPAKQNHARAQYGLGFMYAQGKSVARDYKSAVLWYRLAAARGVALAMNNLGVMHEHGHGVSVDLGAAYAWYDLAAARFDPGPSRDVALGNRDGAAERLSPDELDRARQLVKKAREVATRATASEPTKPQASVPSASSNPITTSSRVLALRIQHALAGAGYDPGPADGAMGAQTRAAISAFQTAQKIPVTGEPSAELLRQIENAPPR